MSNISGAGQSRSKSPPERATSGPARKVHDELAMLYRFKAAMLSTGPEFWSEVLAARVVGTA